MKIPSELRKRLKEQWPDSPNILAVRPKNLSDFVELKNLMLAAPECEDSPDFIIYEGEIVIPLDDQDLICALLFGDKFIEHILKTILNYKEKL